MKRSLASIFTETPRADLKKPDTKKIAELIDYGYLESKTPSNACTLALVPTLTS